MAEGMAQRHAIVRVDDHAALVVDLANERPKVRMARGLEQLGEVPDVVQRPATGSDSGAHLTARCSRLVGFLALAVRVAISGSAAIAQPSYRRADWRYWLEADGDCQNTRQEVLIEESLIQVTLSPDGCRVLAGQWLDPYGGEGYTDPRQLDIDHVVPLGAAHRMGGWRWSRMRKAEFANDPGAPPHLTAPTARMNRQEGDRGPATWLPPRTRSQCRYVRAWQAIATRWALALSPADQAAVHQRCVE